MRRTYLLLAALAACRDKAPPPPPLPPPPHDGVTLLQPGAPPLAPLRYRLRKGTTTASELTCDVDIKSEDPSGPMPRLIVDLETTVEDVLGDGAARLRIAVVGARVQERPGATVGRDAMQAQADAMRGVVIAQTLAPDGAVSDAHVVAPPAAGSAAGSAGNAASARTSSQLDTLLHGLARVAMRLPDEPVGLGATWRERRTLPEGGIRAVSEITYTLTSVAPTAIAYTGAGQSSGPAQTVEQDGVKVEIADPRGRSEVKGSVDLSRYAPEATATSTFSSIMTVIAPDAGPGAERSTVEVTMAIRIGPVPAAGSAAPALEAPSSAPADAAPAPAAPSSAAAPVPDPAQGAHSAP